MARPEEILSPQSRIYAQTPGAAPDSVPFQFRLNSREHEQSAIDTDKRAIDLFYSERVIKNDDIPDIARTIARGNLVGDSLTALGADLTVDTVDATRLQMGYLAHHLLFGVNIHSKEAKYFVAYISRFPLRHRLGGLAEKDFNDLQTLNSAVNGITPKNDGPSVVKPLAIAQFAHRDQQYTCFATAFNPVGEELHVSFDPYTSPSEVGQRIGMPTYHHALNISPDAQKVERAVIAQASALKNKVSRRAGRSISATKLENMLCTDQFATPLINQQRAVLKACATVFEATQGQFPDLHSLNSGDWMSLIDPRTLKPGSLTLVTARGGLARMTDEEWINKMRFPQRDLVSGHVFDPFQSLKDQDMKTVLNQVRRELRK